MAHTGSSSGHGGQNDTNKRLQKRTTDSGIGISSLVKIMKQADPPVAPPTKPNLSGIKSSLHGISYQIKLCIFACLANAKKALDPANKFSFTVVAEDPDAGKFDDIVYYFTDGDQKGSLKIQAKHKIGQPIPKITLNDFMTERDDNNPFALQKYFVSFYDQLQTADMEGLIICTNSDIDDGAKDLWQPVDLGVMGSTGTSLDSYISSLFSKVGGKCYQLDYNKLTDGTLSDLSELFRQCTKRTRLAKLLVNAIKSKEKITRRNVLFKEYRLAILDIIDRNDISKNGSYGFTKEFLDLSSPNSTPGYESFRKEFDEQYQKELNNISSSKDSSGLENLKLKRVYVAKDFFSSTKNELPSLALFPDDKADKGKLQTFCDRFRVVCGTKSEEEVDDLIIDLWWELYSGDEPEIADRRRGAVEGSVAIENLFKTNFDWLMNPFATPLQSGDIKKDLENITNRLAHIKLKGISEKLRKKLKGSPFRINPTALRGSELYKHVENEKVLKVKAYDIPFGVTLLTDLLTIHGKEHYNALLLDESDFTNNSDSIKELLRSTEQPIYLLIACIESYKAVNSIVRLWKKDILNETTKQAFLIKKIASTPSDLTTFCIRDVTDDSWKHFLDENIPLCTTSISPAKLFQYNFQEHSIEEIIKQLDLGRHMGKDNEIVKKYRQIEHNYVQRHWIDHHNYQQAENLDRSDRSEMARIIRGIIKQENMTYMEIAECIKKHSKFDMIFSKDNNTRMVVEPILDDKARKVLILLGEAGFGKSTNLTWLAWHLWNRNPSSWVVRCNLSDHCSEFKRYIQSSKYHVGMFIDENEALRMLYELILLSLADMSSANLQSVRLNARKCSECLVLSNGQATVDEELMKRYDLSLNNSFQLLVFIDKFNSSQLVMLIDGFDEIAPHYKEVVLQFLSLFAQLDGVDRLYLTSRPYGFEELFEGAFKDSLQFQLKPLTLQDKASMLYKAMRSKILYGSNDTHVSDFYQALCVMLIFNLADMSDIPLNLMMSVDIFVQLANRYIDFGSKTVNLELLDAMKDISKPSYIVEKFVDIKIQLIYCKIGAKPNASDNPILIDEYAKKLAKAKRQHGLVSLWVIFDKSELTLILSDSEISKAKDFMKEILEAREKTGIIHGILDGTPMFIHRTFAEYFAAWWIVKRQIKGERQGKIKISSLESFWTQSGVRKQMDIILAKNNPPHLAITEMDGKTISGLFSNNLEVFNQRDDGNRTPLHLLASDTSIYKHINFLDKSIESDIINEKEVLFGWTALDCALYLNFHLLRESIDHSHFIFYLLYHGASINVEILYEQTVLPFQVNIGQAASYARYAMQYLSRLGIQYESHDVTRRMKQFCDKVAACLINEKSDDFGRLLNHHSIKTGESNVLNVEEKSIFNEIIEEDSVWMLESVIQKLADQVRSNLMIANTFFDFALKEKKIYLLKYFIGNNRSLLTEQIFQQCVAMSVIGDYKNEFKFFIDLYCCQTGIKTFNPHFIQNERHLNALFQQFYDVDWDILKIFQINDRIIHNIKITTYNILPVIEIDKNILSVLIISVVLARPSMLRYMKESCKIKFCAGVIYYLARVTDYYILQLQLNRYNSAIFKKYEKHETKLNRLKSAFACLLDEVSNLSQDEIYALLRYAISSDIFSFSKFLIDRYDVGLQVIDDLNGWNVLHLCVSQPRSHDSSVVKSMLELFRRMSDNTDMIFFETVDKEARSILHLAIENDHENILNYIIARKLGLNQLNEIESLGIDAIPNLSFCFRAIHDVTKSVGEKGCYHKVFCTVAKQIANISLNIPDDPSQRSSKGSLLLKENAQELYQVAMKCSSLSLMYYLHREFGCTFPLSISDADWLKWVGRSLNLPDFRVFQWIVRQYCAAHHINQLTEENYEHIACVAVEEFVVDKYDQKSLNLEELVRQAEAKLSPYKSKEEICILKLLVLTVSFGHEQATNFLCETVRVNIDQKLLFDIIEIAHQICSLPRCRASFEPLYEYMFDQIPNLHETDAEGRNILHLAGMSGSNCMLKWLLNNYMVKVTVIYDQNEWNLFHYYASRKSELNDCYKLRENLFRTMLEGVLNNNEFEIESHTQSRMQKIKKICFNSSSEGKSVIHVAFDASNVDIVECIFQLYLGTDKIDEHSITSFEEYATFRECYDVFEQLKAPLPFNAEAEELLDRISKPIDSFLLINIKQTINQEKLDDNVVDDSCRTAIKYRSVSALEYLIMACNHQMNHALVNSSSRDLFVCMMECIRRNMTNLFKVLVAHYCTVAGIQTSVENEYKKDENVNEVEATSKQCSIRWSVIDPVTEEVCTKREYLSLLILTFAYGRLSMTKSLIEMLQLVVTKPLILLLMKATNEMVNCDYRLSVYEYLSSRCGDKINLLHLCAQSRDKPMVMYLTKHKLIDPREIDPENGWNAGHYCVSESDGNNDSRKAIDIFHYLMKDTNIDCFGVYDQEGRSVLRLAIENGLTKVVEYIIKHKLAISRQTEIRQAWDLAKIDECIDEMQRMLPFSIPDNGILLDALQKLTNRKTFVASFAQAFNSFSLQVN